MDSLTYFEIVLYLHSGIYQHSCHWVYKNTVRRRSRKFYTKNGHLYLIGSEIQVLYRSKARGKISEKHRSNNHLTEDNLRPLVHEKFMVMHLQT